MHSRRLIVAIPFLVVLAAAHLAFAQQRFPPPDFESGYKQPELHLQTRHTFAAEAATAALLVAAMGLGAWLLLRKRNRKGLFLLGLASLLYFGFYRGGCICPIGAIQNVTLALGDPRYAVPLLVVVVFVAPLVVALLCGRVFCGAVCPLGAIQDIFLFRPLRVPAWLEDGLGLLRYFFLGLTVYAAAAGSFLMCRYDPFVSLFRFSGSMGMLAFGGGVLAVSLVIGRPFCRYLCPYGALLSLAAKWTGRGVSVTPDDCINCSLCKDACPFGAIVPPREASRASARLRVFLWAVSIVVIAGFAGGGYAATGRSLAGMGLGVWFGGVVVAKLVSVSMVPERKTYEVNHMKCFSCGRCYLSCPRERARLKAEEAPVES